MLRTHFAVLPILVCATIHAQESIHIVGPDASGEVVTAMRGEVERVLRSADHGVRWSQSGDEVEGKLVVLTFRGNCSAATRSGVDVNQRAALAFTAVADGHILPFITVVCDRVRAFLARQLSSVSRDLRTATLGRAVGRLVAHELYHYLAQTTEHGNLGVSRACVRAADLMAERFDFEPPAVAQLRPAPAPVAGVLEEAADDSAGR